MKKLLTILLTCVLLFSLVSCAFQQGWQEQPLLIDLFKCNVGDELPVYPNCTFNCKINDTCTIENLTIKVTLIRKNEINEGDVISPGRNYPFAIEIRAEGTVVGDASALSECRLTGHISPSSASFSVPGTVQGDKIIFVDTYEYWDNSHFGSFVFTGIEISYKK